MKVVETVKITFEKVLDRDRTTYKTAYFNSETFVVINERDITGVANRGSEQILARIAEWLSEGSGWTIDKVDAHYINIVIYRPLNGSSYINLPKELCTL